MEGFSESHQAPHEKKGRILPFEQDPQYPDDPLKIKFSINDTVSGRDVITTFHSLNPTDPVAVRKKIETTIGLIGVWGLLSNREIPLRIVDHKINDAVVVRRTLVLGEKPEMETINTAIRQVLEETGIPYDQIEERRQLVLEGMLEYMVDSRFLDGADIVTNLEHDVPDFL